MIDIVGSYFDYYNVEHIRIVEQESALPVIDELFDKLIKDNDLGNFEEGDDHECVSYYVYAELTDGSIRIIDAFSNCNEYNYIIDEIDSIFNSFNLEFKTIKEKYEELKKRYDKLELEMTSDVKNTSEKTDCKIIQENKEEKIQKEIQEKLDKEEVKIEQVKCKSNQIDITKISSSLRSARSKKFKF